LFNLAHEIRGVAESFELSDQHRILSVLPFSHVLPLVANGLGPLSIGAAVVFPFKHFASTDRGILPQTPHHIFCLRPAVLLRSPQTHFLAGRGAAFLLRKVFSLLLKVAGWLPKPEQRRKLFGRIHHAIGPHLNILASGGSRFDPVVARDLDRLGYTMLQAYGLTETAAAATATPARANAIGTVGKPIRGVSVKIDTPDKDGIGEICIRGPIVMKGYYRDEKATRASVRDGWYHSGDLGRLQPDGSLVITGRSKDVIILANGKNVYPEEMEAHYGQSQWIKEICVIGVTGAESEGERLHAVVVPDMEEFRRRGLTSISESIQFALEDLSKQLPSYYRILSFSIRNEPLPRTVTRKLQRFQIQREETERKTAAVRRETAVEHLASRKVRAP
jgi:long-chain acyl-CoA synthetase